MAHFIPKNKAEWWKSDGVGQLRCGTYFASQNAGKCISNSLQIQNILGGGGGGGVRLSQDHPRG